MVLMRTFTLERKICYFYFLCWECCVQAVSVAVAVVFVETEVVRDAADWLAAWSLVVVEVVRADNDVVSHTVARSLFVVKVVRAASDVFGHMMLGVFSLLKLLELLLM